MVEKVVKISCDWCANFQETSLKGIGLKSMRKKAAKWGWLSVLKGNGGVWKL